MTGAAVLQDRPEAEAQAVDAALERFPSPPGWRVLRTTARLEACWSAPDGRWARYSVRLEPRGAPEDATVFFQRALGERRLTVRFTSSDLSPETVAAASSLMTPLQHLLARAGP